MPMKMIADMPDAPVELVSPLQRVQQMKIGAERSKLTADLMANLAKQGGMIRSPVHGVSNALVNFIGGYNTVDQANKRGDYNKALVDMLSGEPGMTDLDKFAAMNNPAMYVQQRIAHQNALKLQQARQAYEDAKLAREPRDPKKFYPDGEGHYLPLPGAEDFNRRTSAKGEEIGLDGNGEAMIKKDKDAEPVTKNARGGAELSGVMGTFKDEYANRGAGTGIKTAADWDLWIGQSFNQADPVQKAAAAWWSGYTRNFVLDERHELFGAALTPKEALEWDKADIHPSMSADQIRRRLNQRLDIASRHFKDIVRRQRAIYNDAQLSQMYGFDVRSDEAIDRFVTENMVPMGLPDKAVQAGTQAATGQPTARTAPAQQQPGGAQSKAQFNFYMSRAKQHWKNASPEQRAKIIQKIQQDTGVNVTEGDFQ